MEEILNITIDGNTYRKYKECYDSINSGKIAFYFYKTYYGKDTWVFGTRDEILEKMSSYIRDNFEMSMLNYERHIASLKEDFKEIDGKYNSIIERLLNTIKTLESEIETLKRQNNGTDNIHSGR